MEKKEGATHRLLFVYPSLDQLISPLGSRTISFVRLSEISRRLAVSGLLLLERYVSLFLFIS